MIHPDTQVQWISEEKGYGVFATKLIPMGTVSFVIDELDIIIPPNAPMLQDERYKSMIDKYTYVDDEGRHILSWDNGKYMNHCCFPNTLTTGYGFEIVVRDIHPGEEVTDDYGIFTVRHSMQMQCDKAHCRRVLDPNHFDQLCESWDRQIKHALQHFFDIEQPLYPYVQPEIQYALEQYAKDPDAYLSVSHQKPFSKQQTTAHISLPSSVTAREEKANGHIHD